VAILAKMAEMALNHQIRHIVNKNSNEMAKGSFGKCRSWQKFLKRVVAEMAITR